MHEAGASNDLMEKVKAAFIDESGVGLITEYAKVDDELFTEEGFKEYASDALRRMVNPFLRDPVARVTRDPARKLGWEDRMLGAMKLSLQAGVKPHGLAEGARLALRYACEEQGWVSKSEALDGLWNGVSAEQQAPLRELLLAY
jgi:mannitol-1-phosphate 5-dehydrogenase